MNLADPRPGPAGNPPEIQLRLSLDELNLLLEGVGSLPFARVFNLVAKVQAQAAEQLQLAQAAQVEQAQKARPG